MRRGEGGRSAHRADPRAREHRERQLGHHRHEDRDAVALLDAARAQRRRDLLHFIERLGVRVLRRLRRADARGRRAVAAVLRVVVALRDEADL